MSRGAATRTLVAIAAIAAIAGCGASSSATSAGDATVATADAATSTTSATASAPPASSVTTPSTSSIPGAPSPVPRASTAAWAGTLPDGGVSAADPTRIPVRVRIERLGVDAPVLAAGVAPDGSLALPANATDASWVTATATPGSAGSSVVAAHVDYDGARGPFFAIDALVAGDHILVVAADGSTRRFAVRGPAEHHPKVALGSTDVFRRGGPPDLALVTCGGRFDAATRSYEDNVIVRATLVTS